MVLTTVDGLYLHAAWATDERGSNFSLTEFDDAIYVGNYTDTSAVESTDPNSYTWKEIGSENIDDDELEEDTEDYIDIDNLTSSIESLEDSAEDLTAKVIKNESDLQGTQNASDVGLGNANELHNTNRGAQGWTVSAGLALSERTESIYNDTNDPVRYVRITCISAGSNYAFFEAKELREKLAELTEDNSYTFSADMRMSDPTTIPTLAIQKEDGTAEQIVFDAISNAVNADMDGWSAANVWMHNYSTAKVIDTVSVAGQVLYFDLSNMAVGDTLDIANLKIEAGALATPWTDAILAYTWIAYADDDQGTNISLSPYNKAYIGIAVNQRAETVDITDPTVFSWVAIEAGEVLALSVEITSSAGQVFITTTVDTTLTAHVYLNGQELSTSQIADIGTIRWYNADNMATVLGTGQTYTITQAMNVNAINIRARLEVD